MAARKYAVDMHGRPVAAPNGWRILPEGERVPHIHREYIYHPLFCGAQANERWAEPRRTLSTMTAIDACVWGHVIAYAVPDQDSA